MIEMEGNNNNKIEIKVEICREGVQLPTYANDGDSGMDIRAAEDVTISIGETKIIPTGLKMAIPEGYEIQVRPRSGVSLKTPLKISNSPGTIDSGYRDEIGIIISNISIRMQNKDTGELIPFEDNLTLENKYKTGIFTIKKGDRIAQLVLQKVPKMKLVQVDDVKKYGQNRMGGFGSTGTK